MRNRIGNGELEGRGDAVRIGGALRHARDQRVDPLPVGIERHAGGPAIGAGMIERQRQTTQCFGKTSCSRSVCPPCSLLQKRRGSLAPEHLQLQFRRAATPVSPARCHKSPRTRQGHEVAQDIGILQVVVDEQVRHS